jgi:hypothetical protein
MEVAMEMFLQMFWLWVIFGCAVVIATIKNDYDRGIAFISIFISDNDNGEMLEACLSVVITVVAVIIWPVLFAQEVRCRKPSDYKF